MVYYFLHHSTKIENMLNGSYFKPGKQVWSLYQQVQDEGDVTSIKWHVIVFRGNCRPE